MSRCVRRTIKFRQTRPLSFAIFLYFRFTRRYHPREFHAGYRLHITVQVHLLIAALGGGESGRTNGKLGRETCCFGSPTNARRRQTKLGHGKRFRVLPSRSIQCGAALAEGVHCRAVANGNVPRRRKDILVAVNTRLERATAHGGRYCSPCQIVDLVSYLRVSRRRFHSGGFHRQL